MSIVLRRLFSPDRGSAARPTGLLLLGALAACTALPALVPTSTNVTEPTSPTVTTLQPSTTTSTVTSTTANGSTTTTPIRDLDAEVTVPEGSGPFPAVVLVHGGSWIAGSPRSLERLAGHLADNGYLVVNTRYELATLSDPSFPGALHDVACAVRHAAHHPASDGTVTLIGHSSGAHLAAVVALTGTLFGEGCGDTREAGATGLIGLAGPYDITRLGMLAAPVFGVSLSDDPDLWASGNPMELIDPDDGIATLLIHGGADTVVPVRFSEDFAEALEEAGLTVDLEILEDVTHQTVIDPASIGEVVVSWLETRSQSA
ncbi:MAG TPA: alpha/beta hydrolase [Acidimicrobiia bacterium]